MNFALYAIFPRQRERVESAYGHGRTNTPATHTHTHTLRGVARLSSLASRPHRSKHHRRLIRKPFSLTDAVPRWRPLLFSFPARSFASDPPPTKLATPPHGVPCPPPLSSYCNFLKNILAVNFLDLSPSRRAFPSASTPGVLPSHSRGFAVCTALRRLTANSSTDSFPPSALQLSPPQPPPGHSLAPRRQPGNSRFNLIL